MTNFGRIQEINNQCMRNIELIMQESKEQIKNFKMEQAEVMKNIMVSSEGNRELEQQFRNFQNSLSQKEQEQYNQINGRIANEIDSMKRLVLQELSTPSIGVNTSSFNSNSMNNMNTNMGSMNTNSNMPNNNYSNDMMSSYDTSESLDSQLLNEIDGLGSLSSNTNNNNNNVQNNMNNSNQVNYGNQTQGSDIPVETKELDEWISEIKNLI